MKPKQTEPTAIRVLKITTCPTLSGKSTLTYHIGCMGEADIQFRIYANTGGGFYSNEWIAADLIQSALAKSKVVNAVSLHPAFKGKSINTAGFLLAVLKHEGLIGRAEDNPRSYIRTESEAFVAEVKALMDSAVDLDPDGKPGKKAANPVKPVADLARDGRGNAPGKKKAVGAPVLKGSAKPKT